MDPYFSNSPILLLPDYLSRKTQDDIGKAQNNVSSCDISKCMLFKSKICATQHYKPSEYSLMNLDESEVPQIKENSVSLSGGKFIFEYDTQGVSLKEDEINQPTLPVVACNTNQKDAFAVSKVTTRSSQSQEAGFNLGLPNFDNISLVTTPRVQDLGSPAVASEVFTNQLTQGENKPALDSTGESQNEVSNKSNVKLGQFCVEDPHFKNSFDISEYFQQNFKVSNRLRNKQPVYKKSSSKLEAFYNAFVDVAEYLDMNQLFQACKFELYWNRVVDILKTQKAYIMEEKTFFFV